MKGNVLICIVIASLLPMRFCQADQFKDSEASENLFARVYLLEGKTNLDSESKIFLGILEKTNETIAPIIYFPKMTYFCEMQLINSNGVVLPKSVAGKKYGQKFSELKKYSWEAVNKKGHNTGGSDKPDMAIVHTNSTRGPDLPSVQKLFKLEKPGEYKLLLRFQVFKMIQTSTNYTFKLIHIPQVEIPVVKKDSR